MNPKDPAEHIQNMISHLVVAAVASESMVDGLIPVLRQAGRISAELGKTYADVRGSAIARLVEDYGLDTDQAIDATEGMDSLIEKAMDTAFATYAASKMAS